MRACGAQVTCVPTFATGSASLGGRGLHRQRVDRAVVEARLHRRLDQPVLLDPREALELGGGDDGAAGAGRRRLRRRPRPRRPAGPPRSSPAARLRSTAIGSADALADRVEHLVDADELDPGTAVGLAAADLGLVDRLPVLEGDVADALLGEQLLDRLRRRVGRLQQGPATRRRRAGAEPSPARLSCSCRSRPRARA